MSFESEKTSIAKALGQHPDYAEVRRLARKPKKPVKKKRANNEDNLVLIPAVRFLRKALAPQCSFFWHTPNEFKFAQSSDQKRWRQIKAQRQKNKGVVSGVPDIAIMTCGLTIGAEAKFGKNQLSKTQEAVRKQWIAAGGYWITFYSVEELERELRTLGVPLFASILPKKERDAL